MAGKIKAAILVDADNLPIKQAEEALKKLAEICNPVVKKAFGDFTGSAKGWTPEFMRWHGFTPVLHFPVTRFKNGADIAMCIAAMDIVHAKSVEAIVLFTSDSDFAALAARIRESGMTVVGVGDAKANTVLQGAFDTFVVVEPSKPASAAPLSTKPAPLKLENKATKLVQSVPQGVNQTILTVVRELCKEEQTVALSVANAEFKRRMKGFSHTKYGFATISKMLASIESVTLSNGNRLVAPK